MRRINNEVKQIRICACIPNNVFANTGRTFNTPLTIEKVSSISHNPRYILIISSSSRFSSLDTIS